MDGLLQGRLAASLGAALLWGSSTAWAQTAETPASDTATPAEAATAETIPVQTLPEAAAPTKVETAPQQLDAVVVTAQKREQNAQDVPMAVTAFNQRALDNLNITN